MKPEMSCTACRDLLPLWATKRLTTAEYAVADRHLATCPTCQQVARQWEAIAAVTQHQSEHLPPDTDAETSWEFVRTHLPPRTAPRHNERIVMTTQQIQPPVLQRNPLPQVTQRPRPMVAIIVTASMVLLSALVFAMVVPRLHPTAGTAPTLTRATATPLSPTMEAELLNQSIITPGPTQTPIIKIGTYQQVVQTSQTMTPQHETFSFVANSFVYVVLTTNSNVKAGDTIHTTWSINGVNLTSNLTAAHKDCCSLTVSTTGKAVQVMFAFPTSNTGAGEIHVFYNNTLAYTLICKIIPASK